MSTASEGFAAWACDPKRSLEERYGAEILIEHTLGLWRNKHGIKQDTNYEAERLRKKARSLDPAYESAFTDADVGRVEEVLASLKEFSADFYNDRPLRDLSFLRFCPPLQSIRIMKSEITDWSPLLGHAGVTKLDIWDEVARDMRILGHFTDVETLHLTFGQPWPDLSGLEKLVRVREFHYSGNILALQGIPALPQVRDADIKHSRGYNVPLRRVADLPAMPELRRLKLINTASLAGIGRYAQLLNLEIYGYFEDLAPLAELKQLTHLMVSSDDYPTLLPLAHLPELRRIIVRNELPPDLTPLADAPKLHEIALDATHIVPPELASLNAMFNPWSDEFAVPVSRPLAPLKLYAKGCNFGADTDTGTIPRDWGDDKEMDTSEGRWFAREINRRLTALLGQGWGKVPDEGYLSSGGDHVTITRMEDIDRLPEIAQCLRELLATCRHPAHCFLIVDSLRRFERDLEDYYDDEDKEFNAERKREEWEDEQQQKRERREFLERKYRLRLQQELGTPAAPLPPTPAPTEDDAPEEGDTLAATADTAPSEYDLGTNLSIYATLTERTVRVHDSDRALAEMLFGIKAES
jgi:hypothetical protein